MFSSIRETQTLPSHLPQAAMRLLGDELCERMLSTIKLEQRRCFKLHNGPHKQGKMWYLTIHQNCCSQDYRWATTSQMPLLSPLLDPSLLPHSWIWWAPYLDLFPSSTCPPGDLMQYRGFQWHFMPSKFACLDSFPENQTCVSNCRDAQKCLHGAKLSSWSPWPQVHTSSQFMGVWSIHVLKPKISDSYFTPLFLSYFLSSPPDNPPTKTSSEFNLFSRHLLATCIKQTSPLHT